MRRFRVPKAWRESGGTSPEGVEDSLRLLRYYFRFAEEFRMRAWEMGIHVYPHVTFDFYTTHTGDLKGMKTVLWREEVCAQMGNQYNERLIALLDDICRRYRLAWWVTPGGILYAHMTLHFSRDEILGTRRARESDINPGYGESDSDDPHEEFGQCFG